MFCCFSHIKWVIVGEQEKESIIRARMGSLAIIALPRQAL